VKARVNQTRAFVASASENAPAVDHDAVQSVMSPALREERRVRGWAIWSVRRVPGVEGLLRRVRVSGGALRGIVCDAADAHLFNVALTPDYTGRTEIPLTSRSRRA
jgi:hypothetical protein